MKRFLIRLTAFTLVLILIGAALTLITIRQINRKEFFVLKSPDTEVAFLGYSHVQSMIDEKEIPYARNLAAGAEAFFYTFQKAQKIIPNNPKIRKVFIEISNRQIDASRDSLIWSDRFLQIRAPKYASTMEWPEYKFLFTHNPYATLKAFTKVPRQQLVAFTKRNQDVMTALEWGGYAMQTKSATDSLFNAIKQFGYGKDTAVNALSEANLLYLRKLIDLCRSYNLQLWLFRAPLHPMSGTFKNEALFQQVLRERFSDVPFFDLRDYPLKNEERYDLEHVNHLGAKRLSKFFDYSLKHKLFEQEGDIQKILESNFENEIP